MSFRGPSTPALVLFVLIVSAITGWGASRISLRTGDPLDRARTLARAGHFLDAEHAYFDIARHRPISLPLIEEVLDNHRRLMNMVLLPVISEDTNGPPEVSELVPSDEVGIDELLSAPGLSRDDALLGKYWREVIRSDVSRADRDEVISLADREPPSPWANHLLAREAHDLDDNASAGRRFAREAMFFEGREDDADAACRIWLEDGSWTQLSTALAWPRFAGQVPASIRFHDALRSRQWPAVVRWFIPMQWEGASAGVLGLVGVSGLVWFAMCAGIGRITERWRIRVPLYAAAIGLGIISTFVALAVDLVEEGTLGFVEKGLPLADAIYFVVGVALREELAKALLLLPLALLVRRYGSRREAFACGALIGLGFAAQENLGYFHMGLSTALARFLTANVLHVSTTALVAASLDDHLRGRDESPGALSRTLMLVILLHGLYDFFLSSASVDRGSFLAMFTFVLLTRRFVDCIRSLGGHEGPLVRRFCVGLAVVAGASFIYAAVIVGPEQAAAAIFQGALGLAIVIYVLIQQLRTA